MKKLLCLILSLTFLVSSLAMAEEVSDAWDFSKYTDDEICRLLDLLQTETVNRKLERSARLPKGTYLGGRDFPAGNYVLTAAGAKDEFGILYLQPADEEADSKVFDFCSMENDEEPRSYFITVDEGDKLELPFAFILTISPGIQFK